MEQQTEISRQLLARVAGYTHPALKTTDTGAFSLPGCGNLQHRTGFVYKTRIILYTFYKETPFLPREKKG
jgi:hypothetical protein